MLAYRVESNKAGAEYQEQVLAGWQTSKPSDKGGCLLSQNIQVMKKEEILAGVLFKVPGDSSIFQYELLGDGSGAMICKVNRRSIRYSTDYYANIGQLGDTFMDVYSGVFFGKNIEAKLYYKDLIKVA